MAPGAQKISRSRAALTALTAITAAMEQRKPLGILQEGHDLASTLKARLAELEELLSHDEWEPVAGRDSLWSEVAELLCLSPNLRTCLTLPADVDGVSAASASGHAHLVNGMRLQAHKGGATLRSLLQ